MSTEAGFGAHARARDDELYEEGLAHAQAGEWTAALRCFETLAERYPGDPDVSRSLEQARFKARLDQQTRVKPRSGLTIRWGQVLIRALFAVALIALGYFIFQFARNVVIPRIEQQRREAEFRVLVAGCVDAAKGIDTAAGRAACQRVLDQEPNNPEATAALAAIKGKEEEQAACAEAEALLKAGQDAEALEKFMDLQLLFPGACSAGERIKALSARQSLTDLYEKCGQAFDAGNYEEVISACEEVRSRNTKYEEEIIKSRLYTAYYALGKQLVDQDPPRVEALPLAMDYFTEALGYRPKDPAAQSEQRLASQYLAGQQAFESARLDDAITAFSAVVDARPDYLARRAAQRLHDVYLNRGDQYRDAGDVGMAYRMYDLAANVPGVDHATAINRRDSVVGSLTPTPTPTNTATPTPTFTPTPYRSPTPIPPTAVPAPPRKGQILFRSSKPTQSGFWVMNPDGTGRRYLGEDDRWQKLYKELRDREAYSPDGRFRAYALQANGDSSVQIYWQGVNSDGYNITTRVTDFGKISYDPVWAPDGSKIAFVSTARESDDIWVANPDGKGDPKNLTPNPWQWDKHPSWSPDSRQIVFWSNRETKRKLIWVMDANGGNQKCLSENCRPAQPEEQLWEEFDPVWVK